MVALATTTELRDAVLAHEFDAFAAAEKSIQNAVLDALRKSGELDNLLAEGLDRIPFTDESKLLVTHGAYLGLQHASKRLDWVQYRPLARRILVDLAELPAEREDDPELSSLLDECGASDLADAKPEAHIQHLIKESIQRGGPVSWQNVLSLCHVATELNTRNKTLLTSERPIKLAYEIVLGSRRLLKVTQIWDEVWTRIPLIDSDMYYHDSRLRRAILDRNLDHTFRLVAAAIKSGLSAKDVIGHFVKAMYDIDFSNPNQMIAIPFALQALAERDWDPKSQEFQYAMARLAYDVMHYDRTPKERLLYEEISLLKSREILIDFRKGFMNSVFLQAWGIAEYAFVHGFEPVEILDEVFRVAGAIGQTQKENLQAVFHLYATSELLDYLGEDYALYMLAYSIRYLVRQPKVKSRLDPFPDEAE